MERSPLDKLHDQVVRADVVNLANIRMIQCGDGFGFTLEALRELRGGDFDGHVTIQPWITRAIHIAHATCANRSKDFIWAEFVACRERHVLDSAKCSRSGSAQVLYYVSAFSDATPG